MTPLPRAARRSLFIYNLLFPFVFLALLPSFLLRMWRRGNYREKFGQRLGLYSPADRARFATNRWIWIHSISVGETLVALRLARAWKQHDPATRMILSTTTTTGFALAHEAASDWLEPIYNPIDFLPVVRRAFAALRPARIVLIEGEAWPNLLAEAFRRRIPVGLVDARLSPRSEARFRRFRPWTAPIFRLLDVICVPLPEDRENWQSLGVSIDRLHATGSIKFDHAPASETSRVEEFRTLLEPLGITERTPIVVAGSTFPGEEKLLAELLPSLRQQHPNVFLIIVPRHIERVPEILRDLAPLNLQIIRRSTLPHPTAAPHHTAPHPAAQTAASRTVDVLLVDTTGELRDWYGVATITFIGKSLTATGGQNPVEPAVLARPIIFGPHMDNFRSIAQHLLQRDAALEVPDATTLRTTLADLLSAPDRRTTLGLRAQAAVADHQGATVRALSILLHSPSHPENSCHP